MLGVRGVCELSRAWQGAGDTRARTRVAAVPVCTRCPGGARAAGGLRSGVPPCCAARAGAGACAPPLRRGELGLIQEAATPPCVPRSGPSWGGGVQ